MAHAPSKEPAPGLEVVSVSDASDRIRTVRVSRPDPTNVSFIPAALKGLKTTLKHFFRNVTTRKGIETLAYPEQTEPYPERNRGLHRLMLRDDGRVRCVACMCCPTVCPANCITIIPAETDDPDVEKFPAVFEIDELRCVVCGLCVEACPCDAIRMDTGLHAKPVELRGDAIMDKDAMLALGAGSTATQGGKGSQWRNTQGAAGGPRERGDK